MRDGTFFPGGWVKQTVLDLPTPPLNLNLSSCKAGRLTVTWDMPEDLGAMTTASRIAAEKKIGKLSPVDAVDAVGGLGAITFRIQVSASSDFSSATNFTFSEVEAQTPVFGLEEMQFVRR